MIFLFLFIAMFFVAIVFYKKQRPQWKKTILFPQEEVLYTQIKTTINTIGRDGRRRGMAWAALRVTNKRMFFLYPDKKAISKVLDFSGEKLKNSDEKIQRNTLYIDRAGMRIEAGSVGRYNFIGKAVNQSGEIVEYRFLVYEGEKLKNILGI